MAEINLCHGNYYTKWSHTFYETKMQDDTAADKQDMTRKLVTNHFYMFLFRNKSFTRCNFVKCIN